MYRILVRLGIVIVTALGIVSLEGAAAQEPAAAPTATPSPAVGDQIGIPYGPEPHQILDLRLPDASEYRGARPVIVYLHSGGWIGGERGNVPEVVLTQIGRGYAVASADYRLATATPDGQRPASFPGVIWDVKRVVRFLKEKATTWNLDPRRIVLTGTSAGGYLAAFAGATPGLFEPPDLPTDLERVARLVRAGRRRPGRPDRSRHLRAHRSPLVGVAHRQPPRLPGSDGDGPADVPR